MDKVPMTLEGYNRLEVELKRLKTVERPDVIKAIATAREHGDLSENAEYHAAKERQGQVEAMIADIEDRVTRAQIIDPTTLSGDRVVWMDFRNGNFDIYMHDLTTGLEYQITTHPSDELWPAISGDRIVWVDLRNGRGPGNWDIYMYDITTGVEMPIGTAPLGFGVPAISGDRIVWSDTGGDIYLYDIGTGVEMSAGPGEVRKSMARSATSPGSMRVMQRWSMGHSRR